MKVSAEAEKEAALDVAEAVKTRATAEAEAVKIKALADEEKYRVEAAGREKLNEAENALSEAIIKMRIQLETIQNASAIIEASVKPIESIDGMKIINVGGLNGLAGNGHAEMNGSAATGNIADQLINSMLKYRGLAPVVDNILKEVGLESGSIEGLTKVLKNAQQEGEATPGIPEEKADRQKNRLPKSGPKNRNAN